MKHLREKKAYLQYQRFIDNMFDGFAYHKMVIDKGNPVDYVFIEVNQAFRRAMGLERIDIVGRKVTEIVPTIRDDSFDWIGTYGKIVVTGQPLRFETYSRALGKWFLINAFSDKPGYFAVIFQDITAQKKLLTEQTKGQEEYEMIFNSTQDLMFLLDIDEHGLSRYRRLNRSHEIVSDFKTEEVFGKTPQQVFGLSLGNQIDAHFQECVRLKTPLLYEETIKFPSGIRTWLTMLSPVFKDEKVVQIIGSRRDITKQHQIMAELKESEQRYSSLFENNHSVMLIINPQNGMIIDANPAACNYYGYSRAKLKFMHISEINTLSVPQLQVEMQKAFTEQRKHFFFSHRLSNGEIRDVEVYSGPIDISGQHLLYSIVHDIAERKKAEMELFQEKEQLNVTLHSIGDGVITTDVSGRVTLINKIAEKLTGWSLKEAIGKPLHEVFHIINEETRQICDNPVKKVLDTGIIVELANHTVLIAKDGKERFIADSGAPIRGNDGKVFGVVLVFRDVTEKKLKEDEIQYLSFHDSLTGLYNRAFFESEKKRLDREEYLPLSLVIGDVNGLKLTNDIFGHEAGDRLLKIIADILSKQCRDEGIIARWGGDEFVILLPRTSESMALDLCQSIQKCCNGMPEDPIMPNITFGVAAKETIAQDINLVLKEAEDIMYRSKLFEGKSVRSSLITSLGKTLYAKSFETEEHAERILDIAIKVGQVMDLSASELDELRLLAVLHDIGKIGISDNILTKPVQLNQAEWREMKKHPEIGYRIAIASPELSHIADLILYHHERWDGGGYPLGLKGTEIPKLARIVTIIDAYDVMTHSRPYKTAVSPEEAVEEIRNCAGKQFDPDIAGIFTSVITTKVNKNG
jgi:PAS domain S-box/diguanylate cyclase (GGDEF) domain